MRLNSRALALSTLHPNLQCSFCFASLLLAAPSVKVRVPSREGLQGSEAGTGDPSFEGHHTGTSGSAAGTETASSTGWGSACMESGKAFLGVALASSPSRPYFWGVGL